MRIKTFLIIITAFFPIFAWGKGVTASDTISVRRAFIEMPSGELDMLSKNARLDMLDYYDNDSIWNARNNLGGLSCLKEVTNDFLAVSLTPVSTLQLKVLRLKDGKEIVMAIYTTGTDQANSDSEIEFYDSSLNKLDKNKYFPTPKLEYFFNTKGYKTSMKEIEDILPFHTFCFNAGPDSCDVVGRLTYNDVTTVEEAKIIEMFLIPQITFTWNGKTFKKI